MRPMFAIFWRDLLGHFATPKAAIVNCVILILMSLFFNSFIYTYMEVQRTAAGYGGESYTIEQLLKAMYFNLHFILILFVPGITMSTFAAEKKNHTYRLLQKAPIFPWQIVVGKFLSAVSLFALILISTLVYPGYMILFGNPDLGPIFSAYLGLFLLICTQVAFGVWMSSMTSNQFIAFGLTISGVFVLLILNWVAPNISGGGIGEGVLKYFASTPHLDNLIKGLITVGDLTYFIGGTVLFLFFTSIVVDSERWR